MYWWRPSRFMAKDRRVKLEARGRRMRKGKAILLKGLLYRLALP